MTLRSGPLTPALSPTVESVLSIKSVVGERGEESRVDPPRAAWSSEWWASVQSGLSHPTTLFGGSMLRYAEPSRRSETGYSAS